MSHSLATAERNYNHRNECDVAAASLLARTKSKSNLRMSDSISCDEFEKPIENLCSFCCYFFVWCYFFVCCYKTIASHPDVSQSEYSTADSIISASTPCSSTPREKTSAPSPNETPPNLTLTKPPNLILTKPSNI